MKNRVNVNVVEGNVKKIKSCLKKKIKKENVVKDSSVTISGAVLNEIMFLFVKKYYCNSKRMFFMVIKIKLKQLSSELNHLNFYPS